jgi:hypothetical protein
VIRVSLPLPLRVLAQVDTEVRLEVASPVTRDAILDALEARYPVLRGTIRDHHSGKRRAMVRFFVETRDFTHEPADAELPASIASGAEPFRVIGAIAGG